jgi:hypothetical protein
MEFKLSLKPEDIADAIIDFSEDMDEDEVFELIIKLDNKMQCYEFTERLRNHFINEIKEEDGNHIH